MKDPSCHKDYFQFLECEKTSCESELTNLKDELKKVELELESLKNRLDSFTSQNHSTVDDPPLVKEDVSKISSKVRKNDIYGESIKQSTTCDLTEDDILSCLQVIDHSVTASDDDVNAMMNEMASAEEDLHV